MSIAKHRFKLLPLSSQCVGVLSCLLNFSFHVRLLGDKHERESNPERGYCHPQAFVVAKGFGAIK